MSELDRLEHCRKCGRFISYYEEDLGLCEAHFEEFVIEATIDERGEYHTSVDELDAKTITDLYLLEKETGRKIFGEIISL